MRLQITHETRYDYRPAVEVAQHMAYLHPLDSATQEVLVHGLDVYPRAQQLNTEIDVFGNRRSFIAMQTPHEQLRVIANSVVDTHAIPMPPSSVPWEQVRERFRYRADGSFDAAVQFAFASEHAPRHPEFAAYSRASFTPGMGLFAACLDLMHRIHADFKYDSATTEVNTPALEALAQRHGVCQDFAHIMIACLRSLGLAARYVSGYLLTEPPPGQPRLVGSDASHAWASVMLPDLPDQPDLQTQSRWCDFDPTNDRWGWGSPGEDYVVLATGRDFTDVSPIRGIIHGGASHSLRVAVTVARLDEPPAPMDTLAAAAPGATAQLPGVQKKHRGLPS